MTETDEVKSDLQLINYRELSELLGCGIETARALVKSGEIPLVELGPKTHRVRLADVRAYIKRGGSRANV